MWARVVELMLAIWLALSPFILRFSHDETFLWTNNFVCAFLVTLFAFLSFWHPLRKIHLLTVGIAFWLWGLGYSSFPKIASPSLENSVVIGILLFMLAIIPTHSDQLSHPWQEFMKNKLLGQKKI